jgi:hypothetical protein
MSHVAKFEIGGGGEDRGELGGEERGDDNDE